jgi:hypothetical protein
MSARIAPHITLIHAVSDVIALRRLLLEGIDSVGPVRLDLGAAEVWGSPEDGIYLPFEDSEGTIEALRGPMLATDFSQTETITYQPHVTVVHRRTSSPATAAVAWKRIRAVAPIGKIVITEVSIIVEAETRWVTTDQVRLG